MKNSVWYHKLWKKKLDELPVEEDLNAAWSEMQSVLDKNLPTSNLPKSNSLAKTVGSKIVSVFGYILPAAAMIGGVTYFALKQPKIERQSIVKPVKKNNSLLKPDDAFATFDSSKIDSTIFFETKDTLAIIKKTDPNGSVADVVSSLTNEDSVMINSALTDPSKTLIDISVKLINSYKIQKCTSKHVEMNSIYTNRPTNTEYEAIGISRKEKIGKIKPPRRKNNKEKTEIQTPPYNYHVDLGANIFDSNKGVFLGIGGTFAITKRFLANAGIRFNIANLLEGSYTHPSYDRRDSVIKQDITILDRRTLTTADIPISLEYRISNSISLKAGPVIGFLIKKGGAGSKLGIVNNRLDTMYNSQKINDVLNNSTANKFNIGLSGGINIRFKRFNVEAGYKQNITPYKVSSDLGFYKKYLRTFQLGIGYSFK